jgi:hypothetical protein
MFTDKSIVVGAFHEVSQAQEAVRALKKADFLDDQIGLIAHEQLENAKESGTSEKKELREDNTSVEEGATGLAAGAGIGALWALGTSATLLPVIGMVVGGGLLGTILASLRGAATTSAVAKAMEEVGVSEEDAKYYEDEFAAGRTLVTVENSFRFDEARKILQTYGAYDREPVVAEVS